LEQDAMNFRRLVAAPAPIALALGLIAGCSGKKPTVPLVGGNRPPQVRITSAPLDTTQRNYYVITVNWIGFDPDGRVDHFLLAVDPPKDLGSDTLWESTTENTITRFFSCPSPDRPDSTRSADFHVFVIKAVDNKGALSPPVSRAFWSYTVAPTVNVIAPAANHLLTYYLPPSVLFRWEGTDEDGVRSQKPVKYKFKILTDQTEVPLSIAKQKPDSVRRYYAPRFWAGWDSLPGDTTEKQFTALTPDAEYVFVVVAFDEVGSYSPVFTFDDNMIDFRVSFAGAQNPRIGIFNEFFLYEYALGSFRPGDLNQVVQIEVPAGRIGDPEDKLAFNWYASPARDQDDNLIGGPILSYRWAVDIVDLEDETERSGDNDLSHWSQRSLSETSCRIGPYPGGEVHKFYVEAEDINHLISLGTVQFTTVQASLGPKILVVDDTRYEVDRINAGTDCYHSTNRPLGNWPTRAELDTFLFAVGNKPWKCYPPAGTVMTTPGLFNGYDFDTLGTQLRLPDLTIRLSKLGQYGHVVWLVDPVGARNSKGGTDPSAPMTSMRYMNDNRKTNTIAAYVRQGGQVWLAGGGAAAASMINFDKTPNNFTEPKPRGLTFRDTDGELIPGRFMYNQAHWRSEFKQIQITNGRVRRYLGRFENSPGIYAGLPDEMQLKGIHPITDPFPPNREGQSQTVFYQTSFYSEFLSAANEILEDVDPGANEDLRPMLDTLYKATAAALQPDTGPTALQSVDMTVYHGSDNPQFIVTGFGIWNFKRTQCKALLDFVLQKLWGFAPPAPASFASPARAAAPSLDPSRAWSAPATARAAPSRRSPRPAPAAAGPRD
jgi:hypothetical protein